MATSLWPRRPGPFAEMTLPIATGLALGRPNLAACLLAAGPLALFLAREPATYALGYRGEEVRRDVGWRARRIVTGLVAAGVVLLTAGVLVADTRARMSIAGPATLWLLLGALTVRHEDKTFGGELLAGAAQGAASFPIAMAEGVLPAIAAQTWIAWIFGFAAATVALRSLHDKGAVSALTRRTYTWLGALTGVGLVGWIVLDVTRGFAPALPLVGTAWAVATLVPKRRRRAAAWALVVAAVSTGGALVFLTRYHG